MAENCLRRERTAESRGLSGAILSSTIQGWPETKNNSINTGNFFDAKIQFLPPSRVQRGEEGKQTKDLVGSEPFLGVAVEHFADEILGTL